MASPFKFKVRMRDWWRGRGEYDSMLRLENGKMCCLGFLMKELGLSNDELVGHEYPYMCETAGKKIPKWLLTQALDSDLIKCARINDDETINDTERKARLTKMFKRHNIEVEFVK